MSKNETGRSQKEREGTGGADKDGDRRRDQGGEKATEKDEARAREMEKDKREERRRAADDDKAKKRTANDAERPLTAEQVRAKEAQELTVTLIRSHLGYLARPLLKTAEALETDRMTTLLSALIVFALLHIALPTFLVPHLSALVTLICPLQASLHTLARELDRHTKAKGEPVRPVGDEAQWMMYWLVFFVWEGARSSVLVWRPGWTGVSEIARTLSLVGVGGGWYSRAILVGLHFSWKMDTDPCSGQAVPRKSCRKPCSGRRRRTESRRGMLGDAVHGNCCNCAHAIACKLDFQVAPLCGPEWPIGRTRTILLGG